MQNAEIVQKSAQPSDPDGSKVIVKSRRRVFDDFFKVDEVVVSHRRLDGTMSADKRRLVFERGDAVGALIHNQDRNQVILVEEFKAPTLDKGPGKGWIVETMAGMIGPDETPEEAVKREAKEETGYRLTNPELIGYFFSSPGGSSERIFLYYAAVRDSDRVEPGGGKPEEGEEVRIIELTPDALFARLLNFEIHDPKLLIAAYHLRDRLKLQPPARTVLASDTITFQHTKNGLRLGIKTGDIKRVRGVDLWVNSENTDMMMDRVIGRTISANIRYLGAEKDDHGNVYYDTIAEALRRKVGRRGFVRPGTIIDTEPGALTELGVKRILHVATVEGQGPGTGVKADLTRMSECIARVLAHAHARNRGLKLFISRSRSILIPLIGTGDGGLTSEQVAPRIVAAADEFFEDNPGTELREIYFLAYSGRDRAAIETAIEGLGRYKRL